MFFTIFVDNPDNLTEYFFNNKIIVRNKTKDMYGAIRIAIYDIECFNVISQLLK
jgi:hypothetical protein